MAEPIVDQPSFYINGLVISNNATTPNTVLDVALGRARNSTNVFDIELDTGVSINAAVNGRLNALDTGSLANNTFYAVFIIADSFGFNPTGCLMSLSWTAPVLPFGYSILRRIGAVLTDGSAHILKFYQVGLAGNQNAQQRLIQYDAPLAVTITGSGTSSSYLAMDLSVAVPLTNFGVVGMYVKWDPNAAADILNLTPTGATGNVYINTAIGTTVQDATLSILPLISSSKPEVSYKVSAGTLTSVLVMSYVDML